MVMRKQLKKHAPNWDQWHFPFGEKFWSEFPEVLIDEWNDISSNLRTQEQEQPRDVCPNFRKFQVLPGISHLNSVEWFLWKNSIIWEFKAEWKTLLVLQIPNCGHLSKITILKWGIVFFPCLHAGVRVPARVFLSHRRCKASHITCNVTSEKWQEYSKILCVFHAPKLFFPCSPVHSRDKTI